MEDSAPPVIHAAGPDERERVMHTIMLAFSSDPLTRFAAPDAADFLGGFAEFTTVFGGGAFDHKTACVANHGEAAALWFPPGIEPASEQLEAIMPNAIRADRLEDMAGVFEGMGQYHPHEEHWYLPLIGADPAHLGKGLGSALMKYACARIDADGMPAYLESSNPRNISLYERYGFEVMGEIRSGAAPVVTPMYRAARKAN